MANISGVWKWLGYPNGQLDMWSNRYTTEINFKSNMEHFSTLGLETNAVGVTEVFYDGVAVFQAHIVIPPDDPSAYDVQTTINEAYLVMDFGEEQVLPDDIYEFIVQNAQPYELLIADKLAQIARNEQKVFDAGEDAMWDRVQQNGNRTCYDYAFLRWGGEYIRPKYKVVPTESAKNVIYNCPDIVKVEAKYFDLSKMPYGTNANQSHAYNFGTCKKLIEIEDIGLQPSFSYEYFGCWDNKLVKVACIRVDENTIVSNMLTGNPELRDVTIEGTIGQTGINLSSSTKLSEASITSIVNALSEDLIYASGKSITFSKTAVDNAFEGLVWDDTIGDTTWTDIGSESHTWLQLIAPKQTAGWTINLI